MLLSTNHLLITLSTPHPTPPFSIFSPPFSIHHHFFQSPLTTPHPKPIMAIASVAMGAPSVPIASSHKRGAARTTTTNTITGLNSFDGLRATCNVASLGLPVSTEKSFAKIVSSLRMPAPGRRGRGGALTSTCSAADEIFKIASIMNALVLIGVAVGFVLLRLEASLEEE